MVCSDRIMRIILGLFLVPLWLGAQQVAVKEHQLSNGMKVLLLERNDAPSISGGWVARVGSVDERPGITGMAHLFEHMMFKGTPTIGTQDYEKDLEIIAAQEKVRDAMRAEERRMRVMWRRGEITDLQDPDQKTAEWKRLNEEFKKLVEDHRKVIVKNEFDRIYTANGGSGMNAYTSYDHTAYFITVRRTNWNCSCGWRASDCCAPSSASFTLNAMWFLKSAECVQRVRHWGNF